MAVPLLSRIYLGTGITFAYEDRFKEALEYFDKVIKGFPDHEPAQMAYINKAKILYLAGKKREAVDTLKRYLNIYPDAAEKELAGLLLREYERD